MQLPQPDCLCYFDVVECSMLILVNGSLYNIQHINIAAATICNVEI